MVGLFDSPVPSRCSRLYQAMLVPGNVQEEKARLDCEKLWPIFRDYADPNFKTEFGSRTHERWFEMYLTVSLLLAGHQIICPKPGPDVSLLAGDRRIWVEAVCASPGDRGRRDSVPETVLGRVYREPTEQYVLRIRNALEGKQRKYRKYIKEGIVSGGDVSVVAINVFEVDGIGPYIESHFRRALYGVGNPLIRIDRRSGEPLEVSNDVVHNVKKASGAEVDLRPFVNGTMGHITAVLGSHAHVFNRPSKPGEDFALYPNFTGDVPWPQGVLKVGRDRVFDQLAHRV